MSGSAPPSDARPLHPALRFVQPLRLVLYVVLVGSAVLALASASRAFRVPDWLGIAAPVSFGVFLALFGVYRIALVRAGRYPAPKAFVQLGFGALVLMLLVPGAERAASRSGAPAPPAAAADDLQRALRHADPEVRALAAELARRRPDPLRYAPALVDALADPDARVRAEAARSLAAAAGEDAAAGASGEEARARWRAWLKARGRPAP